MIEHPSLLEAEEQVLPTMNKDGSRNWIRPRMSKGDLYWKRLVVAWTLIVVFVSIPHIRIAGKPAILLDVMTRQFTFFGITFFATDAFLLLLLLLSIFLSIFLFTALFGRVWCGWGCPQTVYMEFVFRPIEQWLEGSPAKQRKLDENGPNGRRILKYVIFLVIAFLLGNTFLAYFVGTDRLFVWITRSPFQHPSAFLVMLVVTLAVAFDFGFFREQTCLVACPYGRFQSVLLDKDSLIVAYDYKRGEPRGKAKDRKKGEPDNADNWGACIDCNACVATCPTGIDIRHGLQMECINCTQCIDACDAIMDKIGQPRGLVKYSSQNQLESAEKKLLRGRTIAYPLLITLVFGGLMYMLGSRGTAEVTLLRGGSVPFTQMEDGTVSSQVLVKIANRTRKAQKYHIAVDGPKGTKLIAPLNPLAVEPSVTGSSSVFLMINPKHYKDGHLKVTFIIKDLSGSFKTKMVYTLLGPK